MDIWDENKLILFLAFVIPGFVSLKAYEMLFLSVPKEKASLIIDAVAYSCLNYAILFPAIYYLDQVIRIKDLHLVFFAILWSIILFVAPIIWVILLKVIRQSKCLQKWLPHPTECAWDYVFGKRIPRWVIVVMRDGKKIAGKYGYNSFASSGSCKGQIYIEETWVLNPDGGFERPRDTTGGTLILSPEIESIEFFSYKDENE